MELPDYCRRMDLFVEQVKEWQVISIQAHEMKMTENRRADKALREIWSRLRELEKELLRKDKALAEAAALLILREKFNALRDNSEEDWHLFRSGRKLYRLSSKLSETVPVKPGPVSVLVFQSGHSSAGLVVKLLILKEDLRVPTVTLEINCQKQKDSKFLSYAILRDLCLYRQMSLSLHWQITVFILLLNQLVIAYFFQVQVDNIPNNWYHHLPLHDNILNRKKQGYRKITENQMEHVLPRIICTGGTRLKSSIGVRLENGKHPTLSLFFVQKHKYSFMRLYMLTRAFQRRLRRKEFKWIWATCCNAATWWEVMKKRNTGFDLYSWFPLPNQTYF